MLDYEGKDNSFSINTAKSGLLGKKNQIRELIGNIIRQQGCDDRPAKPAYGLA